MIPTRAELHDIARASRIAALQTALGAVIVIGAIAYSSLRLNDLHAQVEQLGTELVTTNEKLTTTTAALKDAEAARDGLKIDVAHLEATRQSVLQFIGELTQRNKIHLISQNVNWSQVTKDIDALPAGARKNAIYYLILLAWKDVPFHLGPGTLAVGMDSPSLINMVLSAVGAGVIRQPGVPLSKTMMNSFDRTTSPELGDLLIYRGVGKADVGRYVMMYLGPGNSGGHGVCLGALETTKPLQVTDCSSSENPGPPDDFEGYFRPKYPS